MSQHDWRRAKEAAHEVGKLAMKLMEEAENAEYFEAQGTITQRDIESLRQACADTCSWAIDLAEALKEQKVA